LTVGRAFERSKPTAKHRTYSIEFKRQVAQEFLSASTLGQAHLAVGAARAVDDKNDLGSHVVDIRDDLVDQGAHDALLEAGVGRWR
jgi:hypothetical protein